MSTKKPVMVQGDFISNGGKKVVANGEVGNIVINNDSQSIPVSPLVIYNNKSKKESYRCKLEMLSRPAVEMNWQYNGILLKYFVSRRCQYYNSRKSVSLKEIKSEIAHPTLARNIILSGKAGVGKSTVLKWLFVNTYTKDCNYIYLTAKMFSEAETLSDVCEKINEHLLSSERIVVFFDGLDELRCLQGGAGELERFLEYFDSKSGGVLQSSKNRFVITTRPEHFAFHYTFKKRQTSKNLDRYVVYEILPLNYQESLNVCLSIRHFSKFDSEKSLNHFIDKWPDKKEPKSYALSEADYKRLLKKYISKNVCGDFLLSTPLLCRYAYQIVCEWAFQDGEITLEDKFLSSKIEGVLRSYIKWEFHDEYDIATESDEGKVQLNTYIANVFNFLTALSSYMDEMGSIKRKDWEKVQSHQSTSVNAAFCVLQEDENGGLSFVHKSFHDYFLARFFIEKHIRGRRNKKITEALENKIKLNSEFCHFFVEQMLSNGSRLSRYICKAIKNERTIQTTEALVPIIVKHLTGAMHFYYRKGLPFTIEEYLSVFPCGVVKYGGNKFDSKELEKLRITRVLEINAPDLLNECHAESISSKLKLRGVVSSQYFQYKFKMITSNFEIYFEKESERVGGYYSTSFTEQDLKNIIQRTEIMDMLEQAGLLGGDMQRLIESPIMAVIMYKKRELDKENKKEEDRKITGINASLIEFLGADKNYWCLFNMGTIFVCEISQDNVDCFATYYGKRASYSLFDYVVLYGQYRSQVRTEYENVTELKFRKISEVNMSFDFEIKGIFSDSVLQYYYLAHWQNSKLAKAATLRLTEEDFDNILTFCELASLYKSVKDLLDKESNDLLSLVISDEQLITFYLLGQGESMVKLASETIELCKKYGHVMGEEFRYFLMEDETSFVGEDRKKVKEYLQNYIWL